MTLNHNYGCFSTVAGIAGNVSWLDAGGENKPKTLNYKLINPSRK